jgi:hypothetical protein
MGVNQAGLWPPSFPRPKQVMKKAPSHVSGLLLRVTVASGNETHEDFRSNLASTYDHNLFDNVRVGPIRIPEKTKP